MTTQAALNKQIKRLFRLPFAPADPDDMKAVAEEFKRPLSQAINDEHLHAIVDGLMDTCEKFPAPAQLLGAVRETPNPAHTVAPQGCEECGGTGWHYVGERTMDFCFCSKGQWMRDCERERKQEQKSRLDRAARRPA